MNNKSSRDKISVKNKGKLKGKAPWNKGLKGFGNEWLHTPEIYRTRRDSPLKGKTKETSLTLRIISDRKREWWAKHPERKALLPSHNKTSSIELLAQESIATRNWSFVTNFWLGFCSADVRLLDYKILIFCDGCYWHGCKLCYPNLEHLRGEKTTEEIRNRDTFVTQELRRLGWLVIRVWAHEFKRNSDIVGMLLEDLFDECGLEFNISLPIYSEYSTVEWS